ncbi:DUF962 domain-containing protein [Roseomonas populi]|uniref:DUF962 domain-containing protein n=1 Tax=Roseomonas populi TaxID=3121582 RepID=A0ABT1X0Q4_9PROT|nr:DUF962 domain-containing protein [Roseomonas pecuniae]MCR0980539.1 DUF962 domain-containing protein [Roseomonas pecuniae]
MQARFTRYADFWPYYLREHADPRTRRIHVLGTVLGVGLVLVGLLAGLWWLVLAGVVSGYLFAWVSHMVIERNRPATFTYPFWSLGSDLRMAWLFLTGRLEAELRRAGIH